MKAEAINNTMRTGYDIRSSHPTAVQSMKEKYLLKVQIEDEELVNDNCKLKICQYPIEKEGSLVKYCDDCPRQMKIDLNNVDKNWEKWKKRIEKDTTIMMNLQQKAKKHEEDSKYVNSNEFEPNLPEEDDPQTEEETYTPEHDISIQSIECPSFNLRSSSLTSEDTSCGNSPKIPLIPIRFGRKSLNPKVMKAITHVCATYKVSDRDAMNFIVDIANMIFDQQWTVEPDSKKEKEMEYENTTEDKNETQESEEIDNLESSQENSNMEDQNMEISKRKREDTSGNLKKKRNVQEDLTYRMPSRLTLKEYMESASLLNLYYVARTLHSHEGIITFGFDDTTKAAGKNVHDCKVTNITVKKAGEKRKTFTTGFTPNLSHSGENQTQTIKHILQQLATLVDCDVEEFISLIDFWMSDRSSDSDVVLENLNIDEEHILKCNAHIILCIDECINSTLLAVESKVGRDQLIGVDIGSKAFTSKSSVVTLGLIALSKLLSTSHASVPYSLYSTYKLWRSKEGLENSNFKGFSENRFGMKSFLAKLFLEQKQDLVKFFNHVVDENSNKLVLAVSTFINSEWFQLSCQVYATFHNVLIQPLMLLLGIDDKSNKKIDRSWKLVNNFFKTKLKELESFTIKENQVTILQKLTSECAASIVSGVKNQLEKVAYFTKDVSPELEEKMKLAPLTNSGCESRAGQLGVMTNFVGGTTGIQTLSNKQIVKVNGYLKTSDFNSDTRTSDLFKWARTSSECKKVKEINKEFNARVNLTKMASLKAKEELKKKKAARVVKLVVECHKHGGPITESNIDKLLKALTYDQIVTEVSLIKATVAKEVKLKKRYIDPTSKKITFQPLPLDVLKNSVRNVIKPQNSTSSLSTVLQNIFNH